MTGIPTAPGPQSVMRIQIEKEGRPVGYVTVSSEYVGPEGGDAGAFKISGAYSAMTDADRPHVKLACEAAVAQVKTAFEIGMTRAVEAIDGIIPETVELKLRERISKNA